AATKPVLMRWSFGLSSASRSSRAVRTEISLISTLLLPSPCCPPLPIASPHPSLRGDLSRNARDLRLIDDSPLGETCAKAQGLHPVFSFQPLPPRGRRLG